MNGIGSSPSMPRPIATITIPDSLVSCSRWSDSVAPARPASTPSTTNTSVKPATNGSAAASERRGPPGRMPIDDR